ncbi:polysaccharide deacetylase family protein [Candidatus Halocynthiibacter alkanivorans]|uniref:polysaccharide deacetylase family protein n=1 Tax=Candidatus Halocynthiibacter alkanivorans TaxID=2267619 RepID=UPI000DF36524|nr:polysaccharide deacetylase [Candidatus Halocynthiibacter alkanivorans]
MTLQLIDNPPPWPNGARCAVCFAFDFDAESLLHLFFPDDAQRHVSFGANLRYGAQVAMPRIIKIWEHFNMRQTAFVPGWCVEKYPDVIRALVNGGHEIGHHGWLHERINQFSREEERTILLRGIEAIEKVTGKPPVGYRAPSNAFSEHTLDLLLENGFKYDSSLGGHDIPYQMQGRSGQRMLQLPYDISSDDWAQFVHLDDAEHNMPIRAPERAFEVYRADFDAAWKYGGFWTSVWHPFASGRLARADAMINLIEYMIDKGDVWFAPLHEISAHIDGLIARGEWSPVVEHLPLCDGPEPQIARPSR